VFALLEPSSVAITPVALLALGAAGPSMSVADDGAAGSRRRSRATMSVTAVALVACVAVSLSYLAGEVRMRDAYLDTSPAAWHRADSLLPSWPEVAYLGTRIEAFQALISTGTVHRERAIRLARETTARDPANPVWWSYLGNLERKWGTPRAALAAYQQALDRLPWFAPALRGTAELSAEAGDTAQRDQACRRLAEVVRRLPSVCPR
jgi:predicted Zn-dependent protease